MTTKTLYAKTGRYLCGVSMPAETRQIQNWLSCTNTHKHIIPDEERMQIELKILEEVKAHTAYPLFYPAKNEVTWWKKITAFF